MAKIFISYRRDDAKYPTGRLYDALKREFGDDQVFLDQGSIQAADDFHDKIESSLAACSVLLAVIGPKWLDARHENGRRRLDSEDDFVRLELAKALGGRIAVIPVLLEDSEMPAPDKLPQDLKPLTRRNAVKLIHDHWDLGLKALVDQIHRLLQKEKEDAYRAAATEAWRDGEVSAMERKTLQEKRDQLGLTEAQADAIEQPLRQAMEDRQRRLAAYHEDVTQILDKAHPPSKQQRADMEVRREALGLSVEDAQRIDKELLIEAEQRHRDRQRPGPAAELAAPSPPPRPTEPAFAAAAAEAPPAGLNVARPTAGGAATAIAATAFLALDGATGLLRLAWWLLATMLPGALLWAVMQVIGPLAPFWVPYGLFRWVDASGDGGVLALLAACVVAIAGGTWFFLKGALITRPSEVLRPASRGALVAAFVAYSLAGGMVDNTYWMFAAGLAMAVHWITVWVCCIFDL